MECETKSSGRTDENGVYGANEAGGLVALVDEAGVKIKDCEIKSTDANNKLNISGNYYIGGVVGFAKRGVILENVKASNLNIKSTGNNLVAGGIAHASGKVVAKECILNNIDIANMIKSYLSNRKIIITEKGSVDDWKPYIIFNNVKYDFNELDNILFAEYVDHQLFIIGKQNEKTTFIRREVTE